MTSGRHQPTAWGLALTILTAVLVVGCTQPSSSSDPSSAVCSASLEQARQDNIGNRVNDLTYIVPIQKCGTLQTLAAAARKSFSALPEPAFGPTAMQTLETTLERGCVSDLSAVPLPNGFKYPPAFTTSGPCKQWRAQCADLGTERQVGQFNAQNKLVSDDPELGRRVDAALDKAHQCEHTLFGAESSAPAQHGASTSLIPASSSTPPSPTKAAPITGLNDAQVIQITESRSGGYLIRGQLEIGHVTHLAADLHVGDFKAGSGCKATNPETDGMIPARLALTNRTQGFSTEIAIQFDWSSGSFGVEQGGDYADEGRKPSCDTPFSHFGFRSFSTVPGYEQSVGLFFIIPNYFQPDYPAGKAAAVTAVHFSVSATQQNEDGTVLHVDSVSGPGVEADSSGGWTIALADQVAIN